MTEVEKMRELDVLTNGSYTGDQKKTYLSLAAESIIRKAFPFKDVKDVPEKYEHLQCQIAAYLLNKIGAEGELAHSENGISRTYESAFVPDSMLKCVIPYVGGFGSHEVS